MGKFTKVKNSISNVTYVGFIPLVAIFFLALVAPDVVVKLSATGDVISEFAIRPMFDVFEVFDIKDNSRVETARDIAFGNGALFSLYTGAIVGAFAQSITKRTNKYWK